jgi:hypothetical protein
VQRLPQKLTALICILGGLALAAYGSVALLGLDDLAFGKFSEAARDTSSAFLFVLIGIALALFGWFSNTSGGGNADN